MDTRKTIRTELNGLLLVTAETYNDLIPEDINESDLDQVASVIETARQTTEDNLVVMAQGVIEETVKLVKESQAKKESRLTRLVPSDMSLPPAPAVVSAPVKPVLEGPPPEAIPRDVSGPTMEMPTQHLVEATERALQQVSSHVPGISEAVDMDYSNAAGYSHDLELPVAQQNKLKAGIPINVKPPVKTFGLYDAPKNPPSAAVPEDKSNEYIRALNQIWDMVEPYHGSNDAALAMLANSVLAVVRGVMPDKNFPKPSEGGKHG